MSDHKYAYALILNKVASPRYGRRPCVGLAAARRVVTEFIQRLDADLDLKPAAAVVAILQGEEHVNPGLTSPSAH